MQTSRKELKPPPRWPPGLIYVRSMLYTSIPPTVLQHIKGASSNDQKTLLAPVSIRRIEDTEHPALGQMGLFAVKKIAPHTHIIDYLGEVHTDERPDSDHDISLFRTRIEIESSADDGNGGHSAEELVSVGVRLVYEVIGTPLTISIEMHCILVLACAIWTFWLCADRCEPVRK